MSDADGEVYATEANTNASLPKRRRFPVALLVAGGGALLLTMGAGLLWALRSPAITKTPQNLSTTTLNTPPKTEAPKPPPEGPTPTVDTP
ncbi:hypothetical protein ACLESD_47910, partial [Pyxidicoccus sp. 3LFB2]